VWVHIYGSEKGFKYISDKPFIHDVQKRIPDTSKAKQLLGFSAQTTIEEVLDEVVPWIKDAMSKGLI
jgi:nucleoside-diphosphate-sugar epimerase